MDPRSGEILFSNIVITSGWMRAWVGSAEFLLLNETQRPDDHPPHAASIDSRSSLSDQELLRAAWDEGYRGSQDQLALMMVTAGTGAQMSFAAVHALGAELALLSAGFAASTQGGSMTYRRLQEENDRKRALLQRIMESGMKALVMHEVGHTLGLRHNFKYKCVQTFHVICSGHQRAFHGQCGATSHTLRRMVLDPPSWTIRHLISRDPCSKRMTCSHPWRTTCFSLRH